jgi:hypothetical protein
MTRNDFRGAFASDPAYPELAPRQTYLRLSISKNPQRVVVMTGCGIIQLGGVTTASSILIMRKAANRSITLNRIKRQCTQTKGAVSTADGVASECIPADCRTRGLQETLSRARPYIRIRRRLTGQARGCVLHGGHMDQSLP